MKDLELTHELYQDTLNQVCASDELLGKVKDLTMKKTNKHIAKKLASVAAALLVSFAVSNGVAYAATGTTLVEKAVDKINGTEKKADTTKNVTESKNNGTIKKDGTEMEWTTNPGVDVDVNTNTDSSDLNVTIKDINKK